MDGPELIREARRRAGLTQAELAARVGTTQSAIARLEAGRSSPSLRRLTVLVDACGLELRVRLAPVQPPPAEPAALPAGTRDLLAALAERDLEAIVIGDVAAILHGVPLEATGLAIAP